MSAENPAANPLPALFSIAVWFAFSMAVIFTNRYIFLDLRFQFPFTLTTWHLLIATFITRLSHAFTSKVDQVTETNLLLTWPKWATSVLPIGISFSLSLAFANYSYLYLTVALIQMLKSGTPVAILLLSWALRTEKPDWSTFLNILVICFGVSVASYGELHYKLAGLLYVILGITFESIRLVLIQKLLKGQGIAMDAMTALYYFAPVCAFFNFCAASITEFRQITPAHLQQIGVWPILVNGACSFGLNLASVTVVKQTSTLVLGLSGLIKDIIIVCTSSLYFGTTMSSWQFGGYFIALLGLARYKLHKEQAWIKFWESSIDAKKTGFRMALVPLVVILLTSSLYVLSSSDVKNVSDVDLSALYRSEIHANVTGSRRDLMIDRLYAMGTMSWPEYLQSLDSGGLAPLTKEVQNWIYEIQHPPVSECSKKKFVVSKGYYSGMGSMIHVSGVHLGVSLDLDRIMVISDDNHSNIYADPGCGTNKPYTHQECFFQAMSSCTFEDATAPGVDSVIAEGTSFDDKRLHGAPRYWVERLKKEFAEVNLKDEFFKYWWRAQSAAYLMRLNSESSKKLIELRNDYLLHHAWTHANEKPGPLPYPLPSGTINIHVRHGDKASEMTLVPFTKYVAEGLKMIRINPLSFQRRLFVSSEDPDVIKEAIKLTNEPLDTVTGPAASWEVYTSDIPRINGSPFSQLTTYGKSPMTYFWLLQLMMNLECDMFVGTRGSNWNRLIDELRCVWVERCKSPYLEVGPDKDWVNSHWGPYNW